MDDPAIHVERIGDGPRVVCVHGSMSHGSAVFESLRALTDAYAVEFIDRRGFGASPPRPGGVDFDGDADDVAALLGSGAHLVGHSYGAVVALLATGRRPALVRSLTVIEPPAFSLAADDPAVVATRTRLEPVFPAGPDVSAGRWLAMFVGALGSEVPAELPVPGEDEGDVRASMTERPPWEATVDLAPIRAAGVPVLVIRGDWAPDPPGAAVAGAAFRAISEVVVEGTGGRLLVVADSTHAPQVERPDVVLPALRAHLAAAEASAAHRPRC
ncbi:MAG: alpha/beta hydrolase [Chloroflexi bacterium]|nr:alpha/beta hydrolase [Chloroflexota bacterium]